ncbi:hypothetical protein G4B88_029952 [Cannabis sativa]|uniref:DNA2/NAM7 helicase helicase domain-containing protein n=1 Tax=Cannabis sativa TaxID=3483 RepID=A0A7J6EBB0_CANSA|nr:hypothetical protein G4B88_030333 [Cannabis sativa]KAF4379958.1 hypothetical protein G4B88_029950 [Cannabis sativa]KAF4379959.1 hypothetical protein G4B88_029951 [Cannabis sativa]KAF4379960.1 hypothetical protein G4B88_029952 [Cannabis sativa]
MVLSLYGVHLGQERRKSMLHFLKINYTTLICAPTNVAITEVASRVLTDTNKITSKVQPHTYSLVRSTTPYLEINRNPCLVLSKSSKTLTSASLSPPPVAISVSGN